MNLLNVRRQKAGMTSHPKRPRDPNRLAKSIIDIATGQKPDRDPTPEEQGKDPAAVALGRKRGLKGGAARAASLTPEQRAEIAKKAAETRWSFFVRSDGKRVSQELTTGVISQTDPLPRLDYIRTN
jgi:hypothetical protein